MGSISNEHDSVTIDFIRYRSHAIKNATCILKDIAREDMPNSSLLSEILFDITDLAFHCNPEVSIDNNYYEVLVAKIKKNLSSTPELKDKKETTAFFEKSAVVLFSLTEYLRASKDNTDFVRGLIGLYEDHMFKCLGELCKRDKKLEKKDWRLILAEIYESYATDDELKRQDLKDLYSQRAQYCRRLIQGAKPAREEQPLLIQPQPATPCVTTVSSRKCGVGKSGTPAVQAAVVNTGGESSCTIM